MMNNEELNEYQAVQESLDNVPDDISARISEINAKETTLRQFAAKCKIQVEEIKQRTGTLNIYASNLLNIDTQLKKDRETFNNEYAEQLKELDEYEKDLTQEYELVSEQNKNNAETIETNKQVFEQLTKQLELNTAELDKHTKFMETVQQEDPKIEEPVDNKTFESYNKDIASLQTEIQPLTQKIQKQTTYIDSIQSNLNSLKNQNETLKQLTLQHQGQILAQNDEYDAFVAQTRGKISKYQERTQTIEKLQFDMQRTYKHRENKIINIQNKISSTDSKLNKINSLLEEKKKIDEMQTKEYNQIIEEKKNYHETTRSRIEFYKNIEVTNKRAKDRTNEVETELNTTRELQKKTDVEQFEAETIIEKAQESEIDINQDLEKINQEIEVVKIEEDKSLENLKTVQSYVDKMNIEDEDYSKTMQMLTDEYKSLKEKINDAHKDEKVIINEYKAAKSVKVSSDDKDLQDATRRQTIFIDGYKSKLSFVLDTNKTLSAQIRNEEMRNTFISAEYRRTSTIASSTMIRSPSKSVGYLKTEISRLESSLNTKQSKISKIENSIVEKTKIFSQLSNDGEHKKKRIDMISKFTDYLVSLNSDIMKTVDDLRNSSKTIENLNKMNNWNDFISKMLDNAEEYELISQIC